MLEVSVRVSQGLHLTWLLLLLLHPWVPCLVPPIGFGCNLLKSLKQHADCLSVLASGNLQIIEGSSKVSGALYMAGKEHLDLLLHSYTLLLELVGFSNVQLADHWASCRACD